MKAKRTKRGDIYYANLNPVIGSEQGENRPVLVVQNNVGNAHSPTTVIVPLTCNINKSSLPTHVIIPKIHGLEADSLALVEQIRTIDNSRIDGYIGRINRSVQSKIDHALEVCVGLKNKRSAKGELMTLVLCRRCENDFRDSGYVVVKQGWQDIKDDCDFCKVRLGLLFGIFGMPQEDTPK